VEPLRLPVKWQARQLPARLHLASGDARQLTLFPLAH
jgi:hypothetical protein